MALLDDLISDSGRRYGCKTGATLTALDAVEVGDENAGEVIRSAFTDSRVSNAALARLVSKLGYPISSASIRNHRDGTCNCD